MTERRIMCVNNAMVRERVQAKLESEGVHVKEIAQAKDGGAHDEDHIV